MGVATFKRRYLKNDRKTAGVSSVFTKSEVSDVLSVNIVVGGSADVKAVMLI